MLADDHTSQTDSLCKPLSPQNLEELLHRLKNKPAQSWAETSILNGIVHTKKGNSNANIFVDEWPEFSVVIYADVPSGSVLVHCHSGTQHDIMLQIVLQTLRALQQRCVTKLHVVFEQWLFEPLEAVFQRFNSTLCHPTIEYSEKDFCALYLPDNSPLTTDGALTCPDEYVLKNLEEQHAEVVAASWPYIKDADWRMRMFLNMIKCYRNVSLFPKQGSGDVSESPIGWCMQYASDLSLAHLFIDEEHRKKGLAKILVRHMCDCIVKDGGIPVTVVKKHNVASLSLFKKLGFVPYSGSAIAFIGVSLDDY